MNSNLSLFYEYTKLKSDWSDYYMKKQNRIKNLTDNEKNEYFKLVETMYTAKKVYYDSVLKEEHRIKKKMIDGGVSVSEFVFLTGRLEIDSQERWSVISEKLR